VISVIDAASYSTLKQEGKLFAGMLPKIDNAFAAIAAGVKDVLIGHADDLQANAGNDIQGTVIR
ncbi:MAG: acetylglutamate kinase, partial [Chitinophagaceae bacterium]|nr:acetylglutamate kinase [Chitinophagaceae bacterium]